MGWIRGWRGDGLGWIRGWRGDGLGCCHGVCPKCAILVGGSRGGGWGRVWLSRWAPAPSQRAGGVVWAGGGGRGVCWGRRGAGTRRGVQCVRGGGGGRCGF